MEIPRHYEINGLVKRLFKASEAGQVKIAGKILEAISTIDRGWMLRIRAIVNNSDLKVSI